MDMNAGIHKHVIRTNLPARFGSFRKVEYEAQNGEWPKMQ